MTMPLLWAVHISDGVLSPPWLAGGFVGMAALLAVGAWRIRDEEIPKVAVLTAAFFVASLVHVPIPAGPMSSVHLLLTGLVGVVLGVRAALAIPVGLFLQAALMGHGGITALGVNSCVMALPALLSWQLFHALQHSPSLRQPWFRCTLVTVSAFIWMLSVVYSAVLLSTNWSSHLSALDPAAANRLTFHPLTLAAAAAAAGLAAWWERRLETAPEFPLGLLVGEVSVLATVLLQCLVLVGGSDEDWPSLVLISVVPHLCIAVIEGVVLGFTVGYLARVKPEMIGSQPAEKVQWTADSLS
jgi:cobalt/nickel transport system permease protein